MKEIISSLEQIAHAAKSGDTVKTGEKIRAARAVVQQKASAKTTELEKLDAELATWQTKLTVILKEPVGCQGMARHANHWIEELRKSKQ